MKPVSHWNIRWSRQVQKFKMSKFRNSPISYCPDLIAEATSATAWRPDEHCRFTVLRGTMSDSYTALYQQLYRKAFTKTNNPIFSRATGDKGCLKAYYRCAQNYLIISKNSVRYITIRLQKFQLRYKITSRTGINQILLNGKLWSLV